MFIINDVQIEGQLKTTTIRNAIQVVRDTYVINAATDHKLVLDALVGVFTLTLPAGEEGMHFLISPAASNLGTFTVETTGNDAADALIQTLIGLTRPVPVTFTNGKWYAV